MSMSVDKGRAVCVIGPSGSGKSTLLRCINGLIPIDRGTVTVGTDWSEVQSGEIRRLRGQCDAGKMVLTGAQTHIGGRTFRGPTH